ncbi:hypothetical protein NPIL_265961 [Nephila pilipes]|uniref:Secreted protein n=1 Tax=Nephila pilipes TaxID=299642 RepID=A0A8X6NKX2_NEPPI|nr:hypothetical protein NPIL_265961 [Nephila pilipes]
MSFVDSLSLLLSSSSLAVYNTVGGIPQHVFPSMDSTLKSVTKTYYKRGVSEGRSLTQLSVRTTPHSSHQHKKPQ